MTQSLTPLAVRIEEAARLIGVSRATLYRAIAAGSLAVVKLGRRTLVPMDEVQRLTTPTTERR